MRCMFFLKRFDSVARIYSERNILKVTFIHIYFALLLIYKNYVKNEIFKLIEHVSNTRRNNINLICPVFRTTLYKNSVMCSAPKLFNDMPLEIKRLLTTSNINIYKRETKKYVLCLQNR